jgi:hypothetical protein
VGRALWWKRICSQMVSLIILWFYFELKCALSKCLLLWMLVYFVCSLVWPCKSKFRFCLWSRHMRFFFLLLYLWYWVTHEKRKKERKKICYEVPEFHISKKKICGIVDRDRCGGTIHLYKNNFLPFSNIWTTGINDMKTLFCVEILREDNWGLK